MFDAMVVLALSILVLSVLFLLLSMFSLLDELTGGRMSDAIMRAFDKHMEQVRIRKQIKANRRKHGTPDAR